MRLHLVDGTYELFRSFYGAPPKKSPDGREVGATLGLVRSLMLLLSSPEVTHVGVAFDHVIESFRNRLYAGYKTGEGVDPALMQSIPPGRAGRGRPGCCRVAHGRIRSRRCLGHRGRRVSETTGR